MNVTVILDMKNGGTRATLLVNSAMILTSALQ